MAEDRIDSIIDRAAVQAEVDATKKEIADLVALIQSTKGKSIDVMAATNFSDVTKLQKEIGGLTTKINENASAITNEAQAMQGLAKSTKDLTGTLDQNIKLQTRYKIELAKISKEMALMNKVSSDAEKSTARYRERMSALIKRQSELKQGNSDITATIKNQIKENNAAGGSIDALRARYNLLIKTFDSLSIAERQSSAGRILQAEAKGIDEQLKTLEGSTGRFQRNVGNYTNSIVGVFKKGFAGLSTLANILPGLGISGVLLLAFEAVKKLSGAFFSLSDSMKKSEEQQDQLNKAFEDSSYKEAVKNVQELTNYIDLAKNGFADKKDVLDQYNKVLGDTIGKANSLDEAEQLLVKNGEAYIKITLLKAAANSALSEAAQLAVDLAKDQQDPNARDLAVTLRRTEAEQKFGKEIRQSAEFQRLLREENNAFNRQLSERTPENIAAYQKLKGAADSFYEEQLTFKSGGKKAENKKTLEEIALQFQKDAATLAQKFNINLFDGNKDDSKNILKKLKKEADDLATALFRLQEIRLKREADIAEIILENDKKGLQERLAALEVFEKKRLEIIELTRKQEITNAEGNATKIKLAEERATDSIIRLRIDTNKRITQILSSQKVEEQKIITVKVYDKLYSDLEDRIKEYYRNKKKFDDENASNEKKLAEDKKKLQQQLVSELTTLAFTLLTGNIEREKNALQEQIDLLEQKKQKDIEVANQTITNTSDRADAIAVIEARANAQREQLQQKQRQLDNKKAQFDKAQAIARIIQETAAAIVAQIKGLPLTAPIIALISAIGAAQLATVIATPIPKYREGTKDHPGGKMIVGDGKKSEMVVFPDGSIMKTPATDTMMTAPAGTVVYPDFDKAALKMSLSASGGYKERKANDNTPKLLNGLASIEKAIKKIPQPVTVVENVISKRIRKG